MMRLEPAASSTSVPNSVLVFLSSGEVKERLVLPVSRHLIFGYNDS